jgi:hypothetical protein
MCAQTMPHTSLRTHVVVLLLVLLLVLGLVRRKRSALRLAFQQLLSVCITRARNRD